MIFLFTIQIYYKVDIKEKDKENVLKFNWNFERWSDLKFEVVERKILNIILSKLWIAFK